jgi:3-oxoadipate enol-lactonase
MPVSGLVEYNSGSLCFESAGAGPAVVFVHGFGLDRRMWRPQVTEFGRSFQVTTYDCRGFGRSSCPAGPYSHAEDLRFLLQRLGVVAPHLVGLSMGGRIALNYALRWPESVSSLVVIGSDVGGYRHQIDWDADAGREGLDGARATWLRHTIFHATRRNRGAWELVRRMVRDYSGWHWQHEDLRVPADTDTLDRLCDIPARTTVVVGEHDLPDFHTVAGLLAERLPRSRMVVVPGAGHVVNLEAPAACNGILWQHLRM